MTTVDKVRELKTWIAETHGQLVIPANFETKWRELHGDAKPPTRDRIEAIFALGSRVSEQELAELIDEGEMPSIKLSAKEMELIKGGKGGWVNDAIMVVHALGGLMAACGF